jgi:CheY-like chemotaxis protein
MFPKGYVKEAAMQSVLLVEDNRILRLATRHHLMKAGYRVFVAEDGEQALASASSEAPDIVLLDMILPKLSGPDVLVRLKSDPVTAHIPVIVLTGLSKKNEYKLKAQGAIAFMEKKEWMDDPKPLLHAIATVLSSQVGSKEYFESPVPAGLNHARGADR